MKFTRDERKDRIEKSIIENNEKLLDEGLEYEGLFEHAGISIANPYTSECGRFDEIPEEYYGSKYIEWYNNL